MVENWKTFGRFGTYLYTFLGIHRSTRFFVFFHFCFRYTITDPFKVLYDFILEETILPHLTYNDSYLYYENKNQLKVSQEMELLLKLYSHENVQDDKIMRIAYLC